MQRYGFARSPISDGGFISFSLKYTAYAALINKTAVCQGYAVLFYRMALALGVDARVISGMGISGTGPGEAHAWNIVELGKVYFNLDTTWDSTYYEMQLPYRYCLRSDKNFSDHKRGTFGTQDGKVYIDYTSNAFTEAYPMGKADFCEVHTEVKDEAVKPTCVKDGRTEGSHCAVCGEEMVASSVIPAKGHSFAGWETVKAATVFSAGSQSRRCSVCGEQETRSTAKLAAFAKLNKKTVKLKRKKKTTLKVSFADGDAVKSWKSSNKKVAAVNKKGKVTAKKKGKAVITVTLKSGKKAKCTVKVK